MKLKFQRILLFLLIGSSIYFTLNLYSENIVSSKILIPVDKSISSISTISTSLPRIALEHNFGNYSEKQFYQINISESEIIFQDILVSITQKTVKCHVSFTYPTTNNTWKFSLPLNYIDARNYYIKRSTTDFHYTIDDQNVQNPQYIGADSYWILDGNPTITDTLNFEVIVPIVKFVIQSDETNMNKKTYSLSISRFDETPRSYTNVSFTYEVKKFWNNFEWEFYNLTGGINENLTSTYNWTYHFEERLGGIVMVFTLNLGFIQLKTDYAFKFVLRKAYEPPSFWDDLLGNIFLPALMGIIGGFAVFFFAGERIFQKQAVRVQDTKSLVKYGVPLGIVGIIIGLIISYIYFAYLNL